jgi:hypothetical protein
VRFLGELAAARADAGATLIAAQETDQEGGFAFAELPAIPLRVVARGAGLAPSAVDVAAAETGPLRVRLFAAAGVRGRVLGLAPEQRGVQVVLVAGAGRCRAVDVGPGGEFAIEGIASGRIGKIFF